MQNEDLAIRLCLGNMWWSLRQLGGGQPAEGGDSYLAPSAPGHHLWKGVVEGVFKILDGLAWRPLPIPKVPILVEVERRCLRESRAMIKRRVAEYLIKESGLGKCDGVTGVSTECRSIAVSKETLHS